MTGHEPLQRMRRAGLRPACVWVMDDDTPLSREQAMTWHHHPNPFAGKFFAHIVLSAEDIPETMDFRCLVGLHVLAGTTRGIDRAKRLFAALVAAGPEVVIDAQHGWVETGVVNG